MIALRSYSDAYPDNASGRTRWIVSRRGAKETLDANRAYGAFVEDEVGPDGSIWETTTVLLTNRECAFRCLMCDLWKYTLDAPTPPGAIAQQLIDALATLPAPTPNRSRALKLYNAGSFFDPGQVPPDELDTIAAHCAGFDRVIVECHPAFLRGAPAQNALAFRDTIRPATLEVAIGLETVHPETLARLNKRMTVDDFRRAARFLADSGVALRVFLLVRPPFLSESDGIEWACRSLDTAFDAGATLCALNPTRSGNGALDELKRTGDFAEPQLASVEAALRYGLSLSRGRVIADLWEIERFVRSDDDRQIISRLEAMNQTQRTPGE